MGDLGDGIFPKMENQENGCRRLKRSSHAGVDTIYAAKKICVFG